MKQDNIDKILRAMTDSRLRSIRKGEFITKDERKALIKYYADLDEYEICQELKFRNG